MTHVPTRNLAGVQVPDTPLVASDEVRPEEVRALPFQPRCALMAVRRSTRADQEDRARRGSRRARYVLLHDITLNERFAGPRRFEVEGADIARSFAMDSGVDRPRAQLVWDSVALNSTPSIAFYKET